MSTYPGGKSGSGVYQAIINQMPPHETYIEPFLGGGAIMRLKKPGLASIGIDSDAAVVQQKWSGNLRAYGLYSIDILCQDGIDWLEKNGPSLKETTLIYCDPPYLMSTRSSKKPIYKHELTEDDHQRLLSILLELKCMVAISGYWSLMYNTTLMDWRAITFQATTRGGTSATEYLWMNYPEPMELHDYSYLGQNYRQRQDINRKKKRWVQRLATMKPTERHALMAAIEESRHRSTA